MDTRVGLMVIPIMIFTACEGPEGPMGPMGEQGARGEQGPARGVAQLQYLEFSMPIRLR